MSRGVSVWNRLHLAVQAWCNAYIIAQNGCDCEFSGTITKKYLT